MPNSTLNDLYYLQFFLQGVCYKNRVAVSRACSTNPLKPTLYISSSKTVVCTQRYRLSKAGNTQTHKHILLPQPILYISCNKAAKCTQRRRFTKAENTHVHCSTHLRYTFLPSKLKCAIKYAELLE